MTNIIELAKEAGVDVSYEVKGAIPVFNREAQAVLYDPTFIPVVRGCSFSDLERFAAIVRADERKRTVEILMEMHRKANGEHNYYNFAANEIRGFSV